MALHNRSEKHHTIARDRAWLPSAYDAFPLETNPRGPSPGTAQALSALWRRATLFQVAPAGTLLGLWPGVRAKSRRYVGRDPLRRRAGSGGDYRGDLFRGAPFASCAGPDDAGCAGGAGGLDDAQSLGRRYRAALLVATLLA